MNLSNLIEKARAAMSKYHIGIGRRYYYIVDNATNGKQQRFGLDLGGLINFNLSHNDEELNLLAVSNGDNTKAKVYVLVEVCDVEMTDNSLDM